MAAEGSAVLAARWLLQPEELIRVIGDPADAYTRAKGSPNGLAVVARCGNGKALIWDVSTSRKPVQELFFLDVDESGTGGADIAAAVLRGRAVWSADGSRLAMLCSSTCLKIWERHPPGLFAATPVEFTISNQGWPEMAWSPAGSQFALWFPPLNRLRQCRRVASDHGKVWIFDASQTGSDPVELDHGDFQIRGVAWSPDGSLILTWCLRKDNGESSKVMVWDHTKLSCRELHHEQAHVCHVSWSPVRLEIATVSSDGLARIWDMNATTLTPVELDTTVKAGLDAQHVCWSPDGTRLVTSSIRAGLRVCGLRPDDVLLFELKHGAMTDRALSSPASRRFVLPGDELEKLPAPQVWDLCASEATPMHLKPQRRGNDVQTFETIRSWSPDSERLAVVSRATRRCEDSVALKVWLWSCSLDGEAPIELEGLRDLEVHELSWSPDSELIVAACVEGTARLFETRTGALLCTMGQPWNHGHTAWSKGVVSARFLPCGRRIIVSSRSSHMDADTEDCDSICVYGPEMSTTAYNFGIGTSLATNVLPADPNAALQGAQQLLKALHVWCMDGEHLGLQQMSQALTKCAAEQQQRWFGSGSEVASLLFCAPIELALHEAQFQAAAIWGSCEQAEFCGTARDFSWLVNFAIDVDDPVLLHACMLFLLSFDRFSVARRHPSLPPVVWPTEDEMGKIWLWRGGGFNEAWCNHFVPGMRHRIPGYVAMSTDRDRARQRMQLAADRKEPAVEWRVEISSECTDALYLGGLLTGCGPEEFILRPYTVVQIEAVEWQGAGDWQRITCDNPHRITMRVVADESSIAEILPVAPWR